MRQQDLLEKIKQYLSNFESQVRISTANNEYDINIHAENILIPLLNEIYGTNLINLNYSEQKNAEAIDLIDEENKIGIQVTSTRSLEKIKDTINKLLSSKYKDKIKKLYIYILVEKQKSYSQMAIDKIIGKRLKFDVKDNIIDSSDIYRLVNQKNSLALTQKIHDLLKVQFEDVYISKSLTHKHILDFKKTYTSSCKTNFSRINFFGLSVNSTNKPREIELYSLFINPKFSSNTRTLNHIINEKHLKTFNNILISSNLTKRKIDLNVIDLAKITYRNNFKLTELLSFEDALASTHFQTIRTYFKNESIIDFASLFSISKHLVVIGKAGAGKSSFIKYSICKLLEGDKSIFLDEKSYTKIPFRIELHKYNKYKKNHTKGIAEYLSVLLLTEYQITISADELIRIFNSIDTIVFFDGLDEIFDIQDRLSVRNDIETFITSNELVHSIVTSRYESYEEVSLSEKLFERIDINDFDESQITDYVTKWYSIEESSVSIRDREVQNCLKQLINVDAELKNNPLLLSLIVLLYRSELDIPTSKLSIYENCTRTITDHRDSKEKKLEINLSIQSPISIFSALAYYQFKLEKQKSSIISHDTIVNYVKDLILSRGEIQDEILAKDAAEQFLDFAKTRSIYFENKFTHKTFFEYFTSFYIYSQYFTKSQNADAFKNLISEYIGYSYWSVVLELLICKIDSTQIDYEVLDNLFLTQFSNNQIDTILFFLQVVKYIRNVSPRLTIQFLKESISQCFNKAGISRDKNNDWQELLFTHLCSLATINRFSEHMKIAFEECVIEKKIQIEQAKIFALEIAIVSNVTSFIKTASINFPDAESEYIFILQHYPNFYQKRRYLESLKLWRQKFPAELVNTYTSLFKQKIFFGSPFFNWPITYMIGQIKEQDIHTSFKELIDTGLTAGEITKSVSANILRAAPTEFQYSIYHAKTNDSQFGKFIKRCKLTLVESEQSTNMLKRYYPWKGKRK